MIDWWQLKSESRISVRAVHAFFKGNGRSFMFFVYFYVLKF